MSETCEGCGSSEHIAISKGPGRKLGPIANSFLNVFADLPEDFEYLYCTRCNRRVMTPEAKAKFTQFEATL